VAGSLVLLYTETVMENKNSRTGGGLLHDSAMKSEDYLLGVARVMVSIMFLTMMKFDSAGDNPPTRSTSFSAAHVAKRASVGLRLV
jgi:hypothetical protein